MGTHPIFESDFDCLTDKMRLTLARAGFSHSNRVGFSGYGHKFHADEIVPVDKRAFRDLKICEVIIFKFLILSKNYRSPAGSPTRTFHQMVFSWAFVVVMPHGDGSMP